MERVEKRGLPAGRGRLLIRIIFLVVFILTIFMSIVQADEKEASDVNEPNEAWINRWNIPVRDTNDANELMVSKYNAVVTVLQNKELDLELKEKIIEKIISPIFDFELMSKLSLGKTHWFKLNGEEQKKFITLFTKHIKRSYLGNIKLYRDETVVFRPASAEKTGISIEMEIVSHDSKARVLYKLRRAEKKWKIYDVEIEGVSILMTYRSQIDDIIRRGSVKELFAYFEKEPDGK